MTITIFHNPNCGTSRNVLEMIRQSGAPHEVVDYLQTGWTRLQLEALFAAANVSARQALRINQSAAEDLGLLDASISDDSLIAAMVEHPILVNRPFVTAPQGTMLCRPSDLVLKLLPQNMLDHFTKEDGQTIERLSE